MKEYRSNYEYTCDKCGQSIKPQTPYHFQRRYINFHGQGITEYYRIHVECLEGEHEEK